MPERPNIIFSWSDFSQGDYGYARDGGKAAHGTFSARNMLVYRDGYIGPRAGLREITPASMPVGQPLAFVSTPVVARNGFFVIDKKSYYFDTGSRATAPTQLTGDLAVTPAVPFRPQADTTKLLFATMLDSDTADKTYKADLDAGTVAKVHGGSPDTDAPGGLDVAMDGLQMIVGGNVSGVLNARLFASLPTNPNDWHEGRFLDAGDGWQVTALHVLRNSLAILKRTGIHILMGVLGDEDSEVIRRVSTANGVLHSWHSAKDINDRIWFWPLFGFSPAYFDGAVPYYLDAYALPTREGDDDLGNLPLKRGVTTLDGDLTALSVVFVQAGNSQIGIVQHNGIWTFHNFETTISAMCSSANNQFLITDGGGASTAAKFYVTRFDRNRPAYPSDNDTQPGDGTDTPLTCSLTLPQQWSQDGRDVQVRQVIVDFKAWNTGVTQTNHFDVTVKVLGRTRQDEVTYTTTTNGAPASYDEPGTAATNADAGTRKRHQFNFECVQGAGCEITLSNIRGVAIKQVTVLDGLRGWEPES